MQKAPRIPVMRSMVSMQSSLETKAGTEGMSSPGSEIVEESRTASSGLVPMNSGLEVSVGGAFGVVAAVSWVSACNS
jgi:hypothetical protein